MFRLIAFMLLLLAASPGVFWLLYSTLDPCDAVAARVVQMKAPATADSGLARAMGSVVAQGMLVGLTPSQCLEMLIKLEREPGGRLAFLGPDQTPVHD